VEQATNLPHAFSEKLFEKLTPLGAVYFYRIQENKTTKNTKNTRKGRRAKA
jgi:hypothetical protein